MNKIFNTILFLVIASTSTSCATIFTRSAYPITFNSNPSGANVSVVNRAGKTVCTGTTPFIVTLKAAAGYMKREEYSVTFAKDGYAPKIVPVICNLDGWYVGNILIGGLIGMLIIDPVSGTMFKFAETNIHADLGQGDTAATTELRIIDISQVPEGVELVPIN